MKYFTILFLLATICGHYSNALNCIFCADESCTTNPTSVKCSDEKNYCIFGQFPATQDGKDVLIPMGMCYAGTKEDVDKQCKFVTDNKGKCKACQEDDCNTPEESEEEEEEYEE